MNMSKCLFLSVLTVGILLNSVVVEARHPRPHISIMKSMFVNGEPTSTAIDRLGIEPAPSKYNVTDYFTKDVISPARCDYDGETLSNCRWTMLDVASDVDIKMPFPVKSTVRIIKEGNCSALDKTSASEFVFDLYDGPCADMGVKADLKSTVAPPPAIRTPGVSRDSVYRETLATHAEKAANFGHPGLNALLTDCTYRENRIRSARPHLSSKNYTQNSIQVFREKKNNYINRFELWFFPLRNKAKFDGSCRVRLEIAFNEPDVNSKAEAGNIIAELEDDYTHKSDTCRWQSELVLYREAFLFLDSVANYFYTQLSNEQMQNLRDTLVASEELLADFTEQCYLDAWSGSEDINENDCASLYGIVESMAVIGASADWKNEDGTSKTMEEYFGGDSEVWNVIKRLRVLAQKASGGELSEEENERLRQSTKEVCEETLHAEYDLELAKNELSEWLED